MAELGVEMNSKVVELAKQIYIQQVQTTAHDEEKYFEVEFLTSILAAIVFYRGIKKLEQANCYKYEDIMALRDGVVSASRPEADPSYSGFNAYAYTSEDNEK